MWRFTIEPDHADPAVWQCTATDGELEVRSHGGSHNRVVSDCKRAIERVDGPPPDLTPDNYSNDASGEWRPIIDRIVDTVVWIMALVLLAAMMAPMVLVRAI